MPAQAMIPPSGACVSSLIHCVVAVMAAAMLSLDATFVLVNMCFEEVEGSAEEGGGLMSRMEM